MLASVFLEHENHDRSLEAFRIASMIAAPAIAWLGHRPAAAKPMKQLEPQVTHGKPRTT
jgi:hypothetical protein